MKIAVEGPELSSVPLKRFRMFLNRRIELNLLLLCYTPSNKEMCLCNVM